MEEERRKVNFMEELRQTRIMCPLERGVQLREVKMQCPDVARTITKCQLTGVSNYGSQ